MSTSTHSQTGARTSPRHSLSWRLTVTIILIGVAVMLLFGWAAHKQVEMSLLRGGADRAKSASTDLADMLDRSMRQNREDLRQLASRPDLRAFVSNPDNAQFPDSLRARLDGTTVPGIRRIEIWNDSGTRLLEVVRKAPGILSADALPQASPPTIMGFAPMQAAGDVVFTELAEEIRDGPGADARRLGFILVRSTVTGNAEGAVGLLIGPDATFLLGNQGGRCVDRPHPSRACATRRSEAQRPRDLYPT